MIKASQYLIEFLKNQSNIENFADKTSLSRPTIYKLMKGEPVSNDTMSAILKETGFEIGKAFEVSE